MKDTTEKTPTKIRKAPDLRKRESSLWAVRAGLFLATTLLTTTVLVWKPLTGMEAREFMIGEPAPRTLFAPLSFAYEDEEATQALRDQKSRMVPPVFSVDTRVSEAVREKLDSFFLQGPSSPKEETNPEEVRKYVERLLERHLNEGVLDYSKKMELLESGQNVATVISREAQSERTLPVREVPTPNELRERGEKLLPEGPAKNRGLRNAVLDIFHTVLVPNLVWDEEETKERRKKAAESAALVEETIKKDELIVQRGRLISFKEKARIDRIQKKLAEHYAASRFLAVGILVFLTYLVTWVYLFIFERKILLSSRMTLFVLSVFFFTVVSCKAVSVWPALSVYLMPTALASLLLTLLAQPRLGLLGSGVAAVLVAPLADFAPDVIVASLVSGFAGTFASLRVRKRIQFLKVGAAAGLSYFAVLFAFQIFREYSWQDNFQTSVQGLANGLLMTTPLCFFLFVPLFERVFHLMTDMTLLELSDLNHPLLKRMVVEAPGTYHHSLVVSTLAESACEAIGANALLARVGCYFHDIGKISRAEFFTENQTGKGISKHDKLTPTMSCLVIMNHVKDGIELGRRHKLKDPILRFIPEHQGTGVIYYFYKRALDQAGPGEEVNADHYRYPGPKPQSRETAVAMLADSVEAASRSLEEPTPESVRQLVRKIINDKFIDGQLDECDLTLKDLHRIRESFIYNLMAIFHTRVRYPDSSCDDPDRPDLFKHDRFSKFPFETEK